MTSPAKDHAPTRAHYFKLKIMTRKRQNSQLTCLILRHYLPAHLGDMAALTFKSLLPPATGAIRAAPGAGRWAHVVAREQCEVIQKWPLLCSAILRRMVGSDESRKS
jgi:hypothetical protein